MTGFYGLPWWWSPKDPAKPNNIHMLSGISFVPAATHTVKEFFFYIFKEDYPWAKLLELI
jgi:hypothetical protein